MAVLATDAAILQALRSGMNVLQVARTLGVGRHRVRALRNADGIEPAPGRYDASVPTPEEIAEAAALLGKRRRRARVPYQFPEVRRDRRWNGRTMM